MGYKTRGGNKTIRLGLNWSQDHTPSPTMMHLWLCVSVSYVLFQIALVESTSVTHGHASRPPG